MDIRNDCLKSYQDKGSWSLEDAMGQLCTGTWGNEYLQDVPGCLYGWGQNSDGQVGDGTTIRRSSPVQIPSSQWVRIAGGDFHAAAIKSDSTLWTWGKNNHGQLGDDTATPRCSPVQVPGCWKGVAAGGYHTLGVKTDGTLWVWGHNNHGQLGNNNTSNYSSPITLPGTWIHVTDGGQGQQAMYGIKNDNTLWAWGHNNHGRLGINCTSNKSSPVQVPGCWIYVDSGCRHVVAIRNDGTAWGWGHNTTNQRFHCSGMDFSSPIQLPGCNWKYVLGGREGTWLFTCGRRLVDDDCRCVITQ